ncbi:hypothetical protein HY634_04365 [Candidatus Uhrbacteria bacterium]|nr:hypothetical protein [Candidatus Uhrbacteria bacterium]
MMNPTPCRLADSLDASVFDCAMGRDVEASLAAALSAGVAFADGNSPLAVFRGAITRAIREIESHQKFDLLQRLIGDDPRGPGSSLADGEILAAINFIRNQVASKFQGSVGEMLALRPCLAIVEDMKRRGVLPHDAELYAGDSVSAVQLSSARQGQAADFHILLEQDNKRCLAVAGVAEVKSYRAGTRGLERQLAKHVSRAARGLCVRGRVYRPEDIRIGIGPRQPPVKIIVTSSSWKLPRTIAWRDGRTLQIDEPNPPIESDVTEQVDENTWRITLRWSRESLAADAYELTFWYMSKIGEVIYATGSPWPSMTPAEAGRNSIKGELYRAARLPTLTHPQSQRAVALYNIYGFGYALGNHFRSEKTGARAMLSPKDLDQIAATGRAVRGKGPRRESFRIA